MGLGAVGAYLAVVVTVALKAKDLGTNPLEADLRRYLRSPDYRDRVAFVERFHEDFRRIVDVFAGDRKVFVFIDDLDRCEVPTAVGLMKALNLLIADDPRLVFIIGMDREKIAAGLAVKYAELLPFLSCDELETRAREVPQSKQESESGKLDERALEVAKHRLAVDYGRTFLQKFVQLPFRVPSPQADDLERMLDAISPQRRVEDGGWSSGLDEVLRDGVVKEQASQQPEMDENASERGASAEVDCWQVMRVLVGADSPRVKRVRRMADPALGYNPRRSKQFLNLFRLRALIGYKTGLFYAVRPPGGPPRMALSLEQLGKFVAIELAWPALVQDLHSEPRLLGRLEEIATDKAQPLNDVEKRWSREVQLRALLRHGLLDSRGTEPPDGHLSTMQFVNVAGLLRVSPRLPRSPLY